MYKSRTIGIMKHLEESCNNNSLSQMARKNEKNEIIRFGKEFEATGKTRDWESDREHEKGPQTEMERES